MRIVSYRPSIVSKKKIISSSGILEYFIAKSRSLPLLVSKMDSNKKDTIKYFPDELGPTIKYSTFSFLIFLVLSSAIGCAILLLSLNDLFKREYFVIEFAIYPIILMIFIFIASMSVHFAEIELSFLYDLLFYFIGSLMFRILIFEFN
jgi:hypothetical protein